MNTVKALTHTVAILVAVAFFTLLERKLLSATQLRKGPNKVSTLGLLQPVGDLIKLLNKSLRSSLSTWRILQTGPLVMFALFILVWLQSPDSSPSNLSLLVFLMLLSLLAPIMILLGLMTFSKYPLLGGVRSVAQILSYEVIFVLTMLTFMAVSHSISGSSGKPIFFGGIWLPEILFMVALAEANRTPFDFSEGESELVSGFNTEFGASAFAFIFLVEYGLLMFVGVLFVITMVQLAITLSLMIVLLSAMACAARATYPRHRYDLLMLTAWLCLLPAATLIFLCTWALAW